MSRLLTLGLLTGLIACAPSSAVKLDSSSPSAPAWRLQPPSGTQSTIYAVGAAQGTGERFAVEHARGDAARQLVIKHYGVRIASFLQTGQAQETAGTVDGGEFEGATAVREQRDERRDAARRHDRLLVDRQYREVGERGGGAHLALRRAHVQVEQRDQRAALEHERGLVLCDDE